MKKILTVHSLSEFFLEKFKTGFEEYQIIHLKEDLTDRSSITEILEAVRIHKPEFVLVGIPEISAEVKSTLKILQTRLSRNRIPASYVLPEHFSLEEMVLFSIETTIESLVDIEYEGEDLLMFSLVYKEIFEDAISAQDLGLRP